MEVVCVRIGNFNADPERVIDHPHQLSNGDCVRVFEAAITHPGVKYEIVFGVSDSSWPLCERSLHTFLTFSAKLKCLLACTVLRTFLHTSDHTFLHTSDGS